ncbi:MAG TPA: TRAP transporter TatT component family protein, partial [Anaeromyxobacteraceae bacterium]|nr:TRAP transporter TatT component family protein [Anaeromyxobacteraceae bacterium]
RLSPAWAAAVDAGDLVGAAAKVGPEGAEPLYWLALATWSSAREKGLAALLAVKDPALAAMERAAALDPSVDCGGPERALGAWAAALPAAAGGGAARSRRHLERARELGPACLANRVAEAGSLLVLLQDRAAFERTLAEVEAAGDADPRWAPENEVARRQAREMRANAARLF